MTVKKRRGFWRYTFNEGGGRFWGTFNGKKGMPIAHDEVEAKYHERCIRMQIRAGTYRKNLVQEDGGRGKAPEGFEQFFDTVFMGYSKEHKIDWQHDHFRGEVLKQFFRGSTFSEITPMRVVAYINERLQSTTKRKRTRSPVTVHHEVCLLRSVFNMAIAEGVAKMNPCSSIPRSVKKKLPAQNKRNRFLAKEDEPLLLAQFTGRRSHLAPLVKFGIETGLRKSEVCALEVEHLNLSDVSRFFKIAGKTIEVKPNELIVVRSKNGKARTIPLSDAARRIAQDQIADVTNRKYLFTNGKSGTMISEIKRAFTGAVRDAGLEDFRFHDLRHTFATRLAAAGVHPWTIRDLLGHSSTGMTEGYTHTSHETRRSAIEAMSRLAA
jgi:integrase